MLIVPRSYRERGTRRLIGPRDDARHPHMSSLRDPWQDGGSGANPTQIAGMKFWVRGDAVSLDGSNNVQTMTDLSGNSVAFTQGTAASRPGYNATDSLLHNRPSVQLAASKLILNAGFSQAQPLTLYVVGWFGEVNAREIFGGTTSRVDIGMDGSHFYMYAGNVVTSGVAADMNPHAFAFVANSGSGGNSSLYIDSSSSATVGNAGTDALTGPTITVFPPSSGANAEVICYSGAHTASNVALIFRYFGARYGKSWS